METARLDRCATEEQTEWLILARHGHAIVLVLGANRTSEERTRFPNSDKLWTRNQHRLLIRNYSPRFVRDIRRDMRNLTPDATRDW